MARDDKTRSIRTDPSLNEGRREIVLPQSRRFFSASGGSGGERTAAALIDALGIGMEAYVDKLGRDNVEGAGVAINEAAKGGDRKADNKNKGYNDAFDQVEAANDLAMFARELPELLASEGWSDLSEDEAQERIDTYYSGQLAGINPDSLYGKIVAEGILKQNSQLLDVHSKVQAEKAQQERRIMVDNELRSDYELNGEIDHAKLMDRLHKLVPGPGGRMTYLDSAFDLAEDMGAPEIIDSIPELFPSGDPTGITDPNMEQLFDTARSKAVAVKTARKKAADDKFEMDNQTTLAQMHARDFDMAAANDARVLDNIAEGGMDGPNGEPRRYTEEQQFALYKKFSKAHETGEDQALILRDWVSGNGVGYSQNEVDSAHGGFVAAVRENLPPEIETAGEDAINDYIQVRSLALAVVNGKLPSVYSDQMGVNLSNPEKFKQATEMYTQLEAQLPGFAESQIGNAQSSKLYAYNRMLADTGDNKDQAIELMRAYEPGRNSKFNTEIGKVNAVAVEAIVGSDPSFGDFATTSRLQALVNDEVRFYVDIGFEPEVAAGYAVEHIQRRTSRAGDHVYAADAGWGNEPQAVYDWAIENEAVHRGVDADLLTIIPTADPKFVRFVNESNTLPEVRLVRISDLTDDYRRFESPKEQQRAELYRTSTADMKVEAEKRAFDTRYPPNPYGEPGMRMSMNKINREAWAKMPEDKKLRLIQDEMKP